MKIFKIINFILVFIAIIIWLAFFSKAVYDLVIYLLERLNIIRTCYKIGSFKYCTYRSISGVLHYYEV